MKYTDLKDDIIGILHSTDYNLQLKLYDKDGNTTISPKDVVWVYIINDNIMLEFDTEENSLINIWKGSNQVSDDLKTILQRVRELSVLNGVSVKVQLFNKLNRRKIYDIIKNVITTQKEKDMNESVCTQLSKVLFETASMIRTTKQPSDFYISEALQSQKTQTLLKETIESILNINGLNNDKLKSLLETVLIENSISSIKKLLKEFDTKNTIISQKLFENIENIKNLNSFIKQQYLNNSLIRNEFPTHLIKENVKVSISTEEHNQGKLVEAYNHLLTVSTNAKSSMDLLIAIRNNKLCETYNISKEDLMDFWLSKDIRTPIEKRKLLVFEDVNGNKLSYDMDIASGLSTLMDCFNKNGLKETQLVKNIITEVHKLNSLTDLIENKVGSTIALNPYIKIINTEYKHCLENLDLDHYKNNLDKLVKTKNYQSRLKKIEESVGFTHPGLKYIAMYETELKRMEEEFILQEGQKYEHILTEGLAMTLPKLKANIIANAILSEGIIMTTKFDPKSKDKMDIVKSLYKNVTSLNESLIPDLKENLFYIINTPAKFTKTRQKYIDTLVQFIK